MANTIICNGNYIIATAQTLFGTDSNADEIEYILCHQPEAPDGYVNMLRSDTLQWELVEVHEDPIDENIDPSELLSAIEKIL